MCAYKGTQVAIIYITTCYNISHTEMENRDTLSAVSLHHTHSRAKHTAPPLNTHEGGGTWHAAPPGSHHGWERRQTPHTNCKPFMKGSRRHAGDCVESLSYHARHTRSSTIPKAQETKTSGLHFNSGGAFPKSWRTFPRRLPDSDFQDTRSLAPFLRWLRKGRGS